MTNTHTHTHTHKKKNRDLASTKIIFYFIFNIDNNNLILQRSKIYLREASKKPEPCRS